MDTDALALMETASFFPPQTSSEGGKPKEKRYSVQQETAPP